MTCKLSVALWVAFGCVACGGGDPAYEAAPNQFPSSPGNPWIPNITTPVQGPVLLSPGEPEAMGFDEAIHHAYFPLEPGTLLVYEGTADGLFRRDEVRVLDERRLLEGVACTALLQEVYLDGVLSEVTTEWFAQDAQGNVWKFGERTAELQDGLLEPTADSWEAGRDGARPWLFLAAQPELGDLYVGNASDHEDRLLVVATGVTADVPAGLFPNCLQLHENPDDPEDADIILVARDVGLVREQSGGGVIELVRVSDGRTSR